MAADSELLVVTESLKNMLVARATGGADTRDFAELRRKLLSSPRAAKVAPPFLRSCRNADEFWAFIKARFAHYDERREFIREQFDPLLSMLESGSRSPGDGSISTALETVGQAHVLDTWHKALERRATDPEGAITVSRTLLESVCKFILDKSGVAYDQGADLPSLYKLTANQLNLAPSQHTEQIFKQILSGCQTVVEGLGALRNREGDAHGKSATASRPAPRHAEFAVNLASAVAAFLVQTWEARKRP